MAELTEKIKGFLATKRGKTIVIASAAVFVVFLISAAVAGFVLFGGSTTQDLEVESVPTTQTEAATASKTGTEEATTAAKGPDIDQFYEVYEYKDPFRPLSYAEETTSDAKVIGAEDVNMVLDITTDQNNISYASVRYNGQTYDVRVGDVLDRSPYKVLAIHGDTVVFLYGDNQLSVKIGEELGEYTGGSAAGK